MLERVKHSRALPTDINSHQMLSVSQNIHQLVSLTVEPLLEANPHYHAVAQTLGTVEVTIDQVKRAHTRRKYKSVRNMRGVGGNDGVTSEQRFSSQKRRIFERRRTHLSRFRQEINWQYKDLILDPDEGILPAVPRKKVEAVRLLHQIVDRRINGFERLSYEEADAEFTHFFESIDHAPDVLKAITDLQMLDDYQRIKHLHAEYLSILLDQTRRDAIGEEIPKMAVAVRDLRRAIKVLLTLLHFDIENGNPTFLSVLGHIDEIIDKGRSVGKRRRTLDEAAKAEQASEQDSHDTHGSQSDQEQDDQNDPSDQDGQTDPEKGQAGEVSPSQAISAEEVTQG